MKRDFPLFYAIRTEHGEIHDTLCNWARLVRVAAEGGFVSPIFEMYRASLDSMDKETQVWEAREIKPPPIDRLAGWETEKAVRALPERHRAAVRWFYVFPYKPPGLVARRLGVTMSGLEKLVHDSRSMLKNRT